MNYIYEEWTVEGEHSTHLDWINGLVQSSYKGSWIQQTPEESQRIYWLKHCKHNNQDEYVNLNKTIYNNDSRVNQNFCNILVSTSLHCICHEIEAVQARRGTLWGW